MSDQCKVSQFGGQVYLPPEEPEAKKLSKPVVPSGFGPSKIGSLPESLDRMLRLEDKLPRMRK